MEYSVSTLKTNTIQAATGAAVSVANGHTLKMSGMPVQIQVKHVSTKQLINNAADATGVDTVIVSDAFTPKFADSKIFIAIHPMIGSSNLNGGLGIKRTTGGVDTFIQANATGNYSNSSGTIPNSYMSSDESPLEYVQNGQYAVGSVIDLYALDTHGTAPASIVYTMTFHSIASNETLSINQPRTNTTHGFGQSCIILQEWVT